MRACELVVVHNGCLNVVMMLSIMKAIQMAINGHDRNDKANKVVVMKMVKW